MGLIPKIFWAYQWDWSHRYPQNTFGSDQTNFETVDPILKIQKAKLVRILFPVDILYVFIF